MSNERLSRKINENKKIIDIREQKMFEINKALAIETNPDRRFSYTQLVNIEKEYIDDLQSEIDGWESELKELTKNTNIFPTNMSGGSQDKLAGAKGKIARLDVFLCYLIEDKPIAHELYRQLSSNKWIKVWVDEIDLLAGQNREIEIEKAVRSANAVIVCVSKNWATEQAIVHRELRLAIDVALNMPENEIFIIPLKLEKCDLPFSIRNLHSVDYFEMNRNDAYKHLLASLKSRAISLGVSSFFEG